MNDLSCREPESVAISDPMSKGEFDINQIRWRMAQNRKEAIKLHEKLSGLDHEHKELETALRVLERFGAPGADEVSKTDTEAPKLGPPRPDGVPTLYEMALESLREAIGKGKQGLTIRELVNEIGAKYWPGVQPEQITAPIYSFVRKGRLKKNDNGVFKPI